MVANLVYILSRWKFIMYFQKQFLIVSANYLVMVDLFHDDDANKNDTCCDFCISSMKLLI